MHVFADIAPQSFVADPASGEWAAAGSVAVTRGRLLRLNVPHWLRPVAGLLADRYGVETAVHGQPVDFEFVESEPLVIPEAVSDAELALLSAYVGDGPLVQAGSNGTARIRSESRAGVDELFRQEGSIEITRLPPQLAQDIVFPLLDHAGEHFGVPANQFVAQLMAYAPGAEKLWHNDRNPEVEPASWSRTIGLSVLLGQPDEDFTGGELETPAGVVPLQQGDAVAFTSMTPHRVRPVRSGTRAALVVFGAWDGWNR